MTGSLTKVFALITSVVVATGYSTLPRVVAPATAGLALLCTTLLASQYVIPQAATIIVTNTNDSGPGSLRQALANAQDGDTIQFDSALNGQTITLTTGELAIDKTLTITGPGPGLLAVSGASPSRIFHLLSGHVVAVEGLTVRDGDVRNQAQSFCGGAILNDGATLTLNNCIISGNFGRVAGGICSHAGQLTIVDSTISSNFGGTGSSGDSGGIYLDGGNLDLIRSTVTDNFGVNYGGGITRDGGTVTVTDSTISNNRGGAGGGGIKIGGQPGGTVDVRKSTITGNRASCGGGIYNNSSTALVISNSTVNDNFGLGGAICGSGSITNCTISDNTTDFSGGGCGIYATGALEIGNTILKAGANSANILNNGGTITSHGYNLSNDNGGGFLTGPGDQINADPMLGPLQDNGGPTFTQSLLPRSPAIGSGDPNFTPPPFYDQRDAGYLRVYNGRIDIGSFELQPVPTPPPESISIFGSILYCSNPSPGPVPNVVLTFTGSTSGTTSTSSSGNYLFSVVSGGTYTVTPTKASLAPGSAGINTVDVIATQRHFLNLGTPLSGCRLTAADVNRDSAVNTVDVVAIQRFFLGLSTGIANVGKYKFTPINRTYTGVTSNQIGQNYDALVFGDIASPFAEP